MKLAHSLPQLELSCRNVLKLPIHLYHGFGQQPYNWSLRLLTNCRVSSKDTNLIKSLSYLKSMVSYVTSSFLHGTLHRAEAPYIFIE